EREHVFPFNFDRDIFLITGIPPPYLLHSRSSRFEQHPQGLRTILRQAQPFARQLKNIILPAELLLGHISDLFNSRGTSRLPNLQGLWVLLRESGDRFRPEPECKFQQHCPLHYHTICPACNWGTDNWGDIDGAAMRLQHNDFRIIYDASLPRYPRLREIFCARIPVI
ncbi:hypothetical protein B0H66DRAFT_562756, partial [Apodospora peruviana]